MASRFEFKYRLNPADAARAKSMVSHLLKVDEYAQKQGGSYLVTSLYFDTPDLADYYDKLGGFVERKKVRARVYEWPTKKVWLEIKHKYDMVFNKLRATISIEDWEDLLNHKYSLVLNRERDPKDKAVLDEFVYYLLAEGRRPAAWVRYKRTPYVSHGADRIRITFDEHLETSHQNDLNEPDFPTHVSGTTIMEVKFSGGLPAWFSTIIKQLDLRRDSFSKYAFAIDTLYREMKLPK
ncbi:MAG: polyphosphate polymerase domain-containing protein [bacterium]|nr:polyphosphate polymerase domain-containing protein [bacterium]